MKTAKLGMVGHKPTVLIKPGKPSLLTPEQKAKLRYEKRLKACKKKDS